MMKFSLETGHSALDLEIADNKILGVLEGQDIPALGHDRIARILSRGIQAHAPKNLGEKKVALIIRSAVVEGFRHLRKDVDVDCLVLVIYDSNETAHILKCLK